MASKEEMDWSILPVKIVGREELVRMFPRKSRPVASETEAKAAARIRSSTLLERMVESELGPPDQEEDYGF
jgi:hypothetical protein